jgi:outer membrane receptor protein involved in Fe transport
MKNLFLTDRRIGLFTSVGVAALAVSTPAYAQDGEATDEPEEVQLVDNDAATVAEEQGAANTITVTGSRIRRSELAGLEPVTSLTNEYYEARNITNAADALNELPQFRGSVTQRGDQAAFGNGVNFINTFGLGSNRTLSLINGRRVVSSNLPSLFSAGGPGVQVDLNIIPTQLIERIDSVFIGGAPVYGSDAIAGTVNIILKDDYEGLNLSSTAGISDRGDAFNYNISGLFGQNFAEGRGNFTVAMTYDQAEGVRGIDRGFIRDNVGSLNNCTDPTRTTPINDGRINPNIGCNTGGDDGIPARVLFRNLGSPFLSTSGVVQGTAGLAGSGPFGVQFAPDGNSVIPVQTPGNLTGFFGSGTNAYETSDQAQVTADLERFTANAFARFEVTQGVEVYAEGLYYNATSRELGNNPSFNTFVFDPGVSGGITYDTATNPFLSDATRELFLANGLETFNVSRSNEDLFDNGSVADTELKRGVLGVRGEFNAINNKTWNYDVSFNYGTNDIVNFRQNINQQNFVNAVNYTTDADGNAVCTTDPAVQALVAGTPIADPNCVPLNLLGVRQASPEALAYIREDSFERANIRQYVINANVGGDLFDLWAGPVAFNVGYEHRDEKAEFNPSAFTQAGRGRGAAVGAIEGRFNVDEVFGEILVPLASPDNDIPFVHSAEVFGRVRYVDNTVNGGFTSWAAGGQFSPIEDISFRGNFTRSFRAPAITELFLPQSPTFERPPDRCTEQAINAGPVPETRERNCLAFLAATGNNPADYVLLASQASVAGLSGGNPNLDNEQADSFTFGVVARPRFIPGLQITADYIDIEISGPIASLTSGQLATGCFDNENFDLDDPLNGNQFCTQLGFGPDGQIPNDPANPAVRTTFVNGASTLFEGITGTLNYVTSLEGLGIPGSISLGGDMLYVKRRINDIVGVAAARSDGTVGDPEFSGQARVSYRDDNWGFATFVNYTGEQLISRFDRGPSPNDTREFDQYEDFVTVNANIFFRTDDNFRFNFSVTNLFDRLGQSYFGFIVPGSENDEIGRRFAISVAKEF